MKRIYVEAIVAGILLLWSICNNAKKKKKLELLLFGLLLSEPLFRVLLHL